ncbi:MAG: carboxypeptidase regulatory-like domain-containing protein [Candidatus Solibacter sp.]|nr:carboxypeptidase regulatory-like domain-containing protein [Candidatus Solibacter sp.]
MRWIGAFLLLPLSLAAQTIPDDSCSIGGQVSNAATGEPVRRALVYLRRVDSSPGVTNIQVSSTATTDAAGRFAMVGIVPGKYRLSAERSGFIATQYGSRGPGKAGTLLTLDPGQKSNDLAMRLTPHGVIAGRVLDEEGEPVSGVDVQVLRQQYMQGRKQMSRTNGASTNDLGEYRVFGLAPGRYYVSAASRQNPTLPQGEDEYVTTFFPRTTDVTAAAPIDVGPGAQLRNIDIPLTRMHTVTVRGRAVSEVPVPTGTENARRTFVNVMLSARNVMAVGGFARGATVTPEGTFEFRGVTPGSYFVVGAVNLAGKTLTARTPIQVGTSPIEGISLTVRGGVPVGGQVRVEGETTESLAKMRVTLQPTEISGVVFGPIPAQQVKPDGSFQLDDVGADRYTVLVAPLPDGFYVKSVRSANLDVLAGGLEIAGSSPSPLDVVLSPHAGQVTGAVIDPKAQKPAAAVTVVLVPQEKERRDREAFYKTATTDQAGLFSFKSVVPGEYRVYAWEEADYGAWMDPDFMKPLAGRGQAVSVAESGRHAIQVNLISPEQ